MHYLKETLSYILIKGKGLRFLAVISVLLIPSAMIAFGLSAGTFFTNLVYKPDFRTFGDAWLGFFASPLKMVSVAIGAIAISVSFACLIGVIITHFRTGKFSLKYVGRSFNDYFLPSFLHTLFFILNFLLNYTLFTLLVFTWNKYVSGAAYTALGFVTGVVFIGLFDYILSSLTIWLPTMCIKGGYGAKALSEAFYKSRSKQRLFLPTHLLITLVLLATGAISCFASNVWYVSFIIDTIGYAAALGLYLVYCFVAYFYENGLPREDLAGGPYKRRR